MLGLILCGGQSSRMGSDKGLLVKDNTPWAILLVNLLESLGLNVLLSINKSQQTLYKPFFLPNQLVVDNENLEIGGPLKGLLSVHNRFPNEDILLLACDMPLMDKVVLTNLINTLQNNPESEALVYVNEGNPEPICAIYTSVGLKKIMSLCNKNQLPKHSLKYVLEQLNTYKILLPDEWKPYFANYNSPEDLGSLKI